MEDQFYNLLCGSTSLIQLEMGCPEDWQLNTICEPTMPPTRFLNACPPELANPHYAFSTVSHNFLLGQNEREVEILMHMQQNHERRVLDGYKTKLARSKRKLARQRSIHKHSSYSDSFSNRNGVHTMKFALNDLHHNQLKSDTNTISRDVFSYFTLDNKRLRMLLSKELKNSDVGSLGRIILPKKEAEENLPHLSCKEGIQVVIRNVQSDEEWTFRFKYWSNNKSRMYVLENTGEFVKQNHLQTKDCLNIYEDESKNLYFSIKKARVQEASEDHYREDHSHGYKYNTSHTYQMKDDEEASLALLIEQLKEGDKDKEEAYLLPNLSSHNVKVNMGSGLRQFNPYLRLGAKAKQARLRYITVLMPIIVTLIVASIF